MLEWALMPLKRYADFRGRSRRKEYWMFALLTLIIYVVVLSFTGFGAVLGGDAAAGASAGVGTLLLLVIGLALFVPSLAVTIRRFHDQDKSGWFILLGFIPIVGGLILFVFMCLEGTRGENRYGPDPKAAGEHL